MKSSVTKKRGSPLDVFSRAKALVIGDLIIDMYHEGKALGISAETPTIVLRAEKDVTTWGGAGFLVRNMLELGGHVTFLSLAANDEFADAIHSFSHKNLTKVFVREAGRRTTVKERFWSAGHKLLAWDRLDNRPLSRKAEQQILVYVKRHLKDFDKLVISDYRHGMLGESLAKRLVAIAKQYKKPVCVDSQVAQNKGNHLWYAGADLFCLNVKEAKSADPDFDEGRLKSSLARLARKLKTRAVILKLGERGSLSLIGGTFISSKPFGVKAIDTVGAGDAFFAVVSLLPAKLSAHDLMVANAWAGLSTTFLGTQTPTLELLRKAIGK